MKKFLITLLLLSFTLPIFAKNTILILGDSLSDGYGIPLNHSWVALLKKKINDNNYSFKVVNASISGDTTENGKNRLPGLIQKYQPAIVVIELGGNDGLRGFSLALIKRNLQSMIITSKENNAEVLLLGVRLPPNFGAAYTQAFQSIFPKLAQEQQIVYVQNILAGVDSDSSMMQADRVHPKAEAQMKILQNVWEKLEPMLKEQ